MIVSLIVFLFFFDFVLVIEVNNNYYKQIDCELYPNAGAFVNYYYYYYYY